MNNGHKTRKTRKKRERRQHLEQRNDHEEADTSECDDSSRMNDTSEEDDTPEDDIISTSSDDAVTMSASELASTIQQFGRGLDLSTRLCQACRSIIGWFFLDFSTWKRAASNGRFTFIRHLGSASPDDDCMLCGFLARIATGLAASGFGGGDEGYELRATTAITFNTRVFGRIRTPVFCVMPSKWVTRHPQAKDQEDNQHHNAYILPHYPASDTTRGLRVRRVQPYTDLTLVRQWIAFCDAQHQILCCHDTEGGASVPYFCVIDCGVFPLLLVDASYQRSIEYVTLSYCWGEESSEGPDEHGRLPLQLPELIQGVIYVTRNLGYRYLWIDRYCVPQGSTEADKTRRQSLIEDMGKIYEGCAICIIAAAAARPSDGLQGITRPREVNQESIDFGSLVYLQVMTSIRREVSESVWNTRGWTYQESTLARRRLVFTATQCCLQCSKQWFLESLQYPLRHDFNKYSYIAHPFAPRSSWDDVSWTTRVQEYCLRQLSRDSDAVPAFTGIFNRFRFGCNVAGTPLFKYDRAGDQNMSWPVQIILLTGLVWCFFDNQHYWLGQYSSQVPRRRRDVPSWTWCAWSCDSTSYRPRWNPDCLDSRLDFVATTRIAVEDVNGKVAQWSGATVDAAAQKLSTLADARFLRVRGWVCKIAIPETSVESGHSIMHHGPYSFYEWDVPRLNTIAKSRGMRSVNGAFPFTGWVVSVRRQGDSKLERGYVMLLSKDPDDGDVERVDVCPFFFKIIPNLSSRRGFLPELAWSLKDFRIS